MCNPIAFAAVGAGKAVLGHSAQVSAADARNRNRLKAYYAKRGQVYGTHYANLATYYHKGVDAEIAWAENALTANRGIQQKLVEIQQKTQEAVRQDEKSYAEMISNARLGKAAEISGKSAKRVQKSLQAAAGRGKAARQSRVDDAADSASAIIQDIVNKQRVANINAQRSIGQAPRRGAMPNEPIWDKGPGMFSLIANVAMGAASGYMAGGGDFSKWGIFGGGSGEVLKTSGNPLLINKTKETLIDAGGGNVIYGNLPYGFVDPRNVG